MLEIKNLTAGYIKDSPVLKGIDLTVAENEVVGIIGQNGSGKSTLAKAIMNIVPYTSGEILFKGHNIQGKMTNELLDLGFGYFSQGGRIFPNLTIRENLEFVCRKMNTNKRNKRFSEIAEIFDTFNNGRMNLKASYLSGGEQHQLALAMTIICHPILLILDEPSAGLSPSNVSSIYKYLSLYQRKHKIAILLIEQNIEQAFLNSGKILLIDSGQILLKGQKTPSFKKLVMSTMFN